MSGLNQQFAKLSYWVNRYRWFKSSRLRHFFFILVFTISSAAPAQEVAPPQSFEPAQVNDSSTSLPAMELSTPSAKIFDLSLTRNADRPRSYFFSPLISFFVPGFGQFVNAQWAQGAFYGGLGLAAVGLYALALSQPRSSFSKDYEQMSAQLFTTAGGYSAYANFRSAVRSRKAEGKFKFLTHEESVDDIMLAPFDFKYLKRPRTYVPLGIVAALALSFAAVDDEPWALSGQEALHGTAISFMAGTWEEALFRGWLMPVQMEAFDSEGWSNLSTSVIFAALHCSDENPVPLAQFLAGWYLGRTTQKNQWRLGEAIFQHFWYDFIIINGLAYSQNGRNGSFRIPTVTIPF